MICPFCQNKFSSYYKNCPKCKNSYPASPSICIFLLVLGWINLIGSLIVSIRLFNESTTYQLVSDYGISSHFEYKTNDVYIFAGIGILGQAIFFLLLIFVITRILEYQIVNAKFLYNHFPKEEVTDKSQEIK
jgi:hypothetical protein